MGACECDRTPFIDSPAQVIINPPNGETEIVIIWTRWMPHIPLGFK